MLLASALRGIVKTGALTMIDAHGVAHRIEGRLSGPRSTFRLRDPALHRKLLLNARLHVGEAYMDGSLTVEDEGGLYGFMDVLGRNMADFERHPAIQWAFKLQRITRVLEQYNPVGKAQRNVAHHYDLHDALYDLFLDRDRQYSCAYFADPSMTLEQAQDAKKRHIAAKLLLSPGQKVLDIGCGWGGMGLHLAREYGVDVTGVTLSEEQQKVAARRALEAGLDGRARFKLLDYRLEPGAYDRIVSVGMFEHVGARHYDEFFAKARALLKDDGVFVLHSIGRMEPPGGTNPWIRKYVFPGGYTPALSEVMAAVERQGLWVTDVEILRLHYAETLRRWRERFLANRDKVKALAGYDDRFCRMWEFYLAGCEISFRYMNQMVFQLQIAKRQDAVPLTRDYMVDVERKLQASRRTGVAAE